MASTLKCMPVGNDDAAVAMSLLSGSPGKFNYIVGALDALLEQCSYVDAVKSRLLQEEQRIMLRESPSPTDSVLFHTCAESENN